MSQNFFSTAPQIISFLQGCFLVYLLISLLCLFLLAFLLHLMVLAFSSYLLQMNIVLVARCNKLLTTNFVAHSGRHVLSFSSEGDGRRISHKNAEPALHGALPAGGSQSLRPCLLWLLQPPPSRRACPLRPRPARLLARAASCSLAEAL